MNHVAVVNRGSVLFSHTRGSANTKAVFPPLKHVINPRVPRHYVKTNAKKEVVKQVFEVTGVPMVDEMLVMDTIKDAAMHTIRLGVVVFAAVAASAILFELLNKKLPSPQDQGSIGRGFNFITAAVKAACRPSSTLLPFYGMAYGMTLLSSFTQVAATKMGADFNALFAGKGADILKLIKSVTQLMQDATEIVVIVGMTWTCVRLKDYFAAHLCNMMGGKDAAASRLIMPFSNVVSWLMYLSGFMAGLNALGINIQPLLASVGGAGVVIGLAAQSIIGDIAGAVTLYASPPFQAGDSVKFVEPDIEGTIVSIQPMNTVMKLKDGSILLIQNSKVSGWMVNNLSRT